MTETPQDPQKPSFSDRIFGTNPFPESDSRHQLFETNARYAAEEMARMQAKIWETLPANAATSQEFLAHAIDSASGLFDVLAKRLSIMVFGPASVILYEECLTRIIERYQNLVPDRGLVGFSKDDASREFQIRFKQRKAHWMAEAFRLAREYESEAEARQSIAIQKSEAAAQGSSDGAVPLEKLTAENSFLRKGDVWTISYEDESVQLPDSVGLEYIAILLRSPGREIRCSEILTLSPAKRPVTRVQHDNGLLSAEHDNSPDDAAFDKRAKQDYDKRVRELAEEIREAKDCNLILEAEQKTAELEELVHYMEANTDRRGKPRKLPDEHEKARVAVTNAINRAIEKLELPAPKTATYLKTNIRTGDFATYADISTPWKL